jgi:hypothetical protein
MLFDVFDAERRQRYPFSSPHYVLLVSRDAFSPRGEEGLSERDWAARVLEDPARPAAGFERRARIINQAFRAMNSAAELKIAAPDPDK